MIETDPGDFGYGVYGPGQCRRCGRETERVKLICKICTAPNPPFLPTPKEIEEAKARLRPKQLDEVQSLPYDYMSKEYCFGKIDHEDRYNPAEEYSINEQAYARTVHKGLNSVDFRRRLRER